MSNIFLSFFAGLTINLMPCNFPILLIKIYDIVKYSQTKNNKKNIKISAIASSFGIIFMFFIFSLFSIFFKYMDKTFNLGFHFQNTYFLIFTTLLLFLFLLNLLGFFHFDYSPKLINFFQNKYNISRNLDKGIFVENFLTAIFMVLFATPCSVPIIGTIATLSITNNYYIFIIINFIMVGIGMAFPFLLILIYPNTLDFLKNKENILNKTKYIIIFVISITIIWFLYIIKSAIGYTALFLLILFMMTILLQFKFIKKFRQNLIIISLISVFAITIPVSFFETEKAKLYQNTLWINSIDLDDIDNYINEGKTIFVSITAKWCMICNINEITTLSKFKVLNYLKNENTILVKIDATHDNIEADKFYKNKNTISVPKYIVYNKENRDGCSFTGTLNSNKFIKELNKCGYFNNNDNEVDEELHNHLHPFHFWHKH